MRREDKNLRGSNLDIIWTIYPTAVYQGCIDVSCLVWEIKSIYLAFWFLLKCTMSPAEGNKD